MMKKFPNFSDITFKAKPRIERKTRRYLPYSDFNFTSLFCWDTDGRTKVSLLYGNLVIAQPNYITEELEYSLLGKRNPDKVIDKLLQLTDELHLVPEEVVEKIKHPERYSIKEDPDNFDYVYKTSAIASLGGKQLKTKRNQFNKIEKEFSGRLHHRHTDTLGKQLRTDLVRIYDAWSGHNNFEGNEKDAFKRMMEYFPKFGCLLTEIYQDDQLIGFSINEIHAKKFSICHFEKMHPDYKNMNVYLNVQVARKMKEMGVQFMNWEQDLGISGLRKSKRSYYPVRVLKKFSLSLAK